MISTKNKRGFTLIEILVVIGLVAILAAIVLIAINPARQFAQARNSQRESNINTYLNAIGQRIADNKGLYPAVTGCAVPTAGTTYTMGVTGSALSPATTLLDVSCLTPTYIAGNLPVDPSTGNYSSATSYNTQYNVTLDSTGRWTVCAPNHAETAIASSSAYCLTR